MIPMIGLMVAGTGTVVSLYVMARLMEPNKESGKVNDAFAALFSGAAFFGALLNVFLLAFLAVALFNAGISDPF